MLMCSFSVVCTVLVLNLHHRSPDTHKMPTWIRIGVCKWLAWILRMKKPDNKHSKLLNKSFEKTKIKDYSKNNNSNKINTTKICNKSEAKLSNEFNECNKNLSYTWTVSSELGNAVTNNIEKDYNNSKNIKINTENLDNTKYLQNEVLFEKPSLNRDSLNEIEDEEIRNLLYEILNNSSKNFDSQLQKTDKNENILIEKINSNLIDPIYNQSNKYNENSLVINATQLINENILRNKLEDDVNINLLNDTNKCSIEPELRETIIGLLVGPYNENLINSKNEENNPMIKNKIKYNDYLERDNSHNGVSNLNSEKPDKFVNTSFSPNKYSYEKSFRDSLHENNSNEQINPFLILDQTVTLKNNSNPIDSNRSSKKWKFQNNTFNKSTNLNRRGNNHSFPIENFDNKLKREESLGQYSESVKSKLENLEYLKLLRGDERTRLNLIELRNSPATHDENETERRFLLSQILFSILDELQFITDKLKLDEIRCEVCNDWKFAAMVIDRLCLWFFTIFTSISTLVVFYGAPHVLSE